MVGGFNANHSTFLFHCKKRQEKKGRRRKYEEKREIINTKRNEK
jgi:hypothetical protein